MFLEGGKYGVYTAHPLGPAHSTDYLAATLGFVIVLHYSLRNLPKLRLVPGIN